MNLIDLGDVESIDKGNRWSPRRVTCHDDITVDNVWWCFNERWLTSVTRGRIAPEPHRRHDKGLAELDDLCRRSVTWKLNKYAVERTFVAITKNWRSRKDMIDAARVLNCETTNVERSQAPATSDDYYPPTKRRRVQTATIDEDDDGRMRRRCASVMRDLSSQKRQRELRFEDLSFASLDITNEQARAEVSELLAKIHQTFFASMYEMTVNNYRSFDEASRIVRSYERRIDLLARNRRHCQDAESCTYRWLHRRLVEEYARCQFFRLVEYLRCYLLFAKIREGRRDDGDDDVNDVDIISYEKWLSLTSSDSTTTNGIERCATIVESAVTLHAVASVTKSFSSPPPSHDPANLYRMLIRACKFVIDRNNDGTDESIDPPWNVHLERNNGGDIQTTNFSNNGGDECNSSEIISRQRRIENDDYFVLYRTLIACDRNYIMCDATFYSSIFTKFGALLRVDESKSQQQ